MVCPCSSLDANQFYGGESASLMYREFMEFLEEIPATRPANVESVQSELSTSDTQRYFLQSSFPMLYENVEQEFVEQLVQPEPTVLMSLHANLCWIASSCNK